MQRIERYGGYASILVLFMIVAAAVRPLLDWLFDAIIVVGFALYLIGVALYHVAEEAIGWRNIVGFVLAVGLLIGIFERVSDLQAWLARRRHGSVRLPAAARDAAMAEAAGTMSAAIAAGERRAKLTAAQRRAGWTEDTDRR